MLGAAMDRFAAEPQRSILAGVSDAAFDAFQRAMASQRISDVSKEGLGSFALGLRRLGELGVMANLRRAEAGRWCGDWVPPYSEAAFLGSLRLQAKIFHASVRNHDAELAGLARPAGASRSGCLAILHRGGLGALREWPAGAFRSTKALFERANGLF
jgi:hypothetical protein